MILDVSDDKLHLTVNEADETELSQLRYFMRRRIDNYFFHPLVKQKKWDGYINFMDKNNRIPVGLWGEIKEMAKDNSFDLKIRGISRIVDKDFDDDGFDVWVNNFFDGSGITPRDYQLDAAKQILRLRRSISEIATAAGKTLIMFIVFAYLLQNNKAKKFMVIVPNITLIEQTLEKFLEYTSDKFEGLFSMQMLFGGVNKKIHQKTNLIIGTFQTLVKFNAEFFGDVDCVCVDESHYAQAKSLQTIFKNMPNAEIRFGLSGTSKVKNSSAQSFTVQSHLGPLCNKIKAEELFKKGYTTPVDIRIIYMDYLSEEDRKKLKFLKSNKNFDGKKLLALERKIATNNPLRNKFIIDLSSKMTENTLLLFYDVQNEYGKLIYNTLNDKLDPHKFQVFYIDGSTSTENREYYRNQCARTDIVTFLVASFGVFSTGVDVPNLYNIFLLESFKSEVIIKQTLGRGMRLFKNKSKVVVYDLVDDFRISGFVNVLYKHSSERIILYEEENFEYKKFKKNLQQDTTKVKESKFNF